MKNTYSVQRRSTSKYSNKKVEYDGHKFDSIKESARYKTLKLLEQLGHIKNLRLQVNYALTVNNIKVCTYRADFVYEDVKKGVIVEDAKGFKTDIYKLKKKLMFAVHNIQIKEV